MTGEGKGETSEDVCGVPVGRSLRSYSDSVPWVLGTVGDVLTGTGKRVPLGVRRSYGVKTRRSRLMVPEQRVPDSL